MEPTIRAKLMMQLQAECLSGWVASAAQKMSLKSNMAVPEAAETDKVGWDGIADRAEGEV